MRAATLLNLIYLYKKASSLFGLSAPLLSVFSLRTLLHFRELTTGEKENDWEIWLRPLEIRVSILDIAQINCKGITIE